MGIEQTALKTVFFILIVSVLITVNFGCKKGKATVDVRGIVIDKTLSQPLSGATAYLYEVDASGSEVTLIGESTTDTDGNYRFSFLRNTVLKYQLVIEKENYFSIQDEINFSDLTVEHGNLRNYATTAMAWAKLRFITSSSSTVQFNRVEGKINCPLCCDDGVKTLTGPMDTSIYCINDGNTVYAYQYVIQGTSNTDINSITTVAFDTTEILLEW